MGMSDGGVRWERVTEDGPESAEEFAETMVNMLSARGRRVLMF